jgi:hypothetical protein
MEVDWTTEIDCFGRVKADRPKKKGKDSAGDNKKSCVSG